MATKKQIWWLVGVGLVIIVSGVWLITRSKPVYLGEDQPRPPLGPVDAKIIIDEYSDFQCPACKSAQTVVKDVLASMGDRVQLRFYHYPLVTIHTQAFRAALAAECANDQGKFWQYHDILFDKQPQFSRDELVEYARTLGLTIDGDKGFAACLDSKARTDAVRADMSEAKKFEISGTPTFYVNGERVADWPKLKEYIQAKLIGG